MLSNLPRLGSPRRFPLFLILLFGSLVFVTSALAATFSARALGDFNQVAVVEVAGNFDALDPLGQPNIEPRLTLAREFYRTHGDDYDFLVIFTNFDVRMPTLQAKAFFSPVRNDVQGIGLPLYDNSAFYSSDGASLQHLEGTIDMGNLAVHVLEPADPRFETTLRVLTHEMLHRWGAYVRFLDAGIASDALLGIDRAHWSFLLDSAGSTLCGNRWQDNQDGTFTALTPESAHPGELFGRLLNPLELYLMGLSGAESVPPLQLIDAPGLDPAQLPAPGVTIPGMTRTITIDDIIAAEGPRLPPAAETRKELRMAFILAVAPGSFAADDPAAGAAQLVAIDRLRSAWEQRFAILTDGIASMRTQLVPEASVAANPQLPDSHEALAVQAHVDAGVAWLLAQQQTDGRWQEQPGTALRDTAEAVKALTPFPLAATAVARGREWLRPATAANHDFLARQVAVRVEKSSEHLLAAANDDGGWGGEEGFRSNPLDTALALQALTVAGTAGLAAESACAYLHATQQADGGWSGGSGSSQLLPTCAALSALNPWRTTIALESPVAEAQSWLASDQNHDGGFGHPSSNVLETAVALLALKSSAGQPDLCESATVWLLANQLASGSWQGRPFATALAVQALHAAQVAADLVIAEADIAFVPSLLTEIPGEVTVSVDVHNLGRQAVEAIQVVLYAGDPKAGGLQLGEQRVAVAGNASTGMSFAVPIDVAGVHPFFVSVDAAEEVTESDEWNNIASKSLIANLPPPTVGFAETASLIAEGAGQFTLSVVLSHPWDEPLTLTYEAGVESSAVVGSDYQLLSGTLTVPGGATAAQFTVHLLDDQVAEIDKLLVITLDLPTLGTLGQRQHSVTLLDDEPPAITIVSPPSGILGTASPALLFSTTAASVQVQVDGQLLDTALVEQLGPLADGPHQLEVVASNRLGMTSSRRVDFQINTTLPTIAIQAPITGTFNEMTPLLVYTVSAAAGYSLNLDGVPLTKASGERLDPLPDGAHLLKITAWNQAGTQMSVEVPFVVDTVPPEVAIIYPNDDVLRESTPTLFCAGDELTTTTVNLDGFPLTTRCGERLGPLADGVHRVEVTATDVAGNQATATADFVVFTGDEVAYPSASGWPRSAARFYGGLAVDSFGNVYLATQDASYTLMIQKYTSQGVLLWQHRPFSDIINPRDLAVDAAGNLFVVGYTGTGDGFVYKFATADGVYLAGHNFVTAGSDYAFAVQVDDDDQVVVAGDTGGDLYGSPNGTMNVWVARLDNDCRLVAGRQLTRTGTQRVSSHGSLALDQAGNVYLTGYTDTATFGPSAGGDDAILIKFNQSLWPVAPALQFGSSGADQGLDVTVDIYGNIYVGGISETPVSYLESGFIRKFDALGNSLQHITVGSQPLRSLICERDGTLYGVDELGTVGKYSSDLQLLWSRNLGWNYRHQLARDRFGDLYAAGDGGTSGSYASILKLTDARRPAVTLDNSHLQVNRQTVELSGTLSSEATIDLVSPTLQRLGAAIYPQAGRWQMTVSGLAVGVNQVEVQATTAGGFTRRAQGLVSVDVTPPQVAIRSPVDGQSYTIKPLLDYAVSDGQVAVLVNGVPLYKTSGQLLEALQPGWNIIRVEATDLAGNVGFALVKIFADGAAVGELPLSQTVFTQAGTAAGETVVATARDPSGSVYLLGQTTGSFSGYVNAGNRDPFIAKFDSAGRHLTTWQFGLTWDETGVALVADAHGNLYATWNVQYVNNKGELDFAVRLAKFTGSGTLVWQTELNSSANDLGRALTLDRSGDVLLGGETFGSLDKQRYGGAGDYFLAKYSAAGAKQWVRLSNAASADSLQAIAIDAAGNLFGAAAVASMLGGVAVPEHVALLAFDSVGSLLKVEPLPLPGSDFTVKALHSDAQGRLLIAGSNGSRYFLAAYDGSLQRHWLELSAATDSIALSTLLVDGNGSLLAAGQAPAAFAGNRAFGGSDGVVVKHAPTGARQWSLQFGSTGNDYVGGMVMGADGALWLGGHTDGLLGVTRAGSTDLYLARMMRPELPGGPQLQVDSYPQLTNATSLNLSGTATPGARLEAVAHTPATLSAVNMGSDGVWHLSAANLLPNTDHLLTINASNELGTTSLTIAVTVDTLPPLLTVAPPLSPTMLAAQTLTGTVEVGAQLSVVTPLTSVPVELAVVAGQWSYPFNGLASGDNRLDFTARDAAGNTTTCSVTIRYLPPPPPTLSIAPLMIGANEAADIVITIGQVAPFGSPVALSQVLDLDGNGYADAVEPVVRRFLVSDGLRAGNPSLPGDEDGIANGEIVVRLNGHFVNDRFHAAGDYLFVATTAAGSATVPFAVLPGTALQEIRGAVRDEQGDPVGGALVELTDRWGHSLGFSHADRLGNYRLTVAQPGEFQLWPTAAGYLFSLENLPSVVLAAGQTVVQNLLILTGNHIISGTLRDAVTSAGVAGVTVRAVNARLLATALTDAHGDYALSLAEGDYQITVAGDSTGGLAGPGYLTTTTLPLAVTVNATSFDNDLTVVAATTTLCGQVTTASEAPVAGVPVQASHAVSGQLTQGLSNRQGVFCVGTDGGNEWEIAIPEQLSFAAGWVGTQGISNAAAELTVYPLDAWVTGTVVAADGQPLAGIALTATHAVGVATAGVTAADGRYRLGLASEPAGGWSVLIDSEPFGYLPIPAVTVNAVPGVGVVADFALQRPSLENTIAITKASYDARKKVLSVEATSSHADAQLQVDGYGAMSFFKLLKGKYYWSMTLSVAVKPLLVTVSGLEGSATATVP